MRAFATLVATTLLGGGCASDLSPQSYSVGSVGQVNRTVAATVISVREVDVAGTTATGGAIGATTDAVAGSALGGSNAQGNILGAIGGAVVGGVVGASIEANATKQKAAEYVVETENGNPNDNCSRHQSSVHSG